MVRFRFALCPARLFTGDDLDDPLLFEDQLAADLVEILQEDGLSDLPLAVGLREISEFLEFRGDFGVNLLNAFQLFLDFSLELLKFLNAVFVGKLNGLPQLIVSVREFGSVSSEEFLGQVLLDIFLEVLLAGSLELDFGRVNRGSFRSTHLLNNQL